MFSRAPGSSLRSAQILLVQFSPLKGNVISPGKNRQKREAGKITWRQERKLLEPALPASRERTHTAAEICSLSSSSRPITTRCPREPGRSDACYPSYLYEVYHTGDTWVSGAGQYILQQGFSDASSGNIQPRSSINHRPTPKQSICAIDFFD